MERVIAGDGIVLRIWQPGDRPVIQAIVERSLPEFSDWLPGLMHDLADLDAFLSGVETAFLDGTGFFYAVEEGGAPVGQCSVHVRDRALGVGEVGYWIRTDRTGRGIAPRAVAAVAEAAFEDWARQLVIHCDEGNVRSAAVARKAGFTHEATHPVTSALPPTPAQTGREMRWVRRRDGGRDTL